MKKKNPHAQVLGRLGGIKGGKARWVGVPPGERSEIARRAALARWKTFKKDTLSRGRLRTFSVTLDTPEPRDWFIIKAKIVSIKRVKRPK